MLILAAACGTSGGGPPGPGLQGPTTVPAGLSRLTNNLRSLLHPAHKYYGISVGNAPVSLQPLRTVATQTGKTPSLVEYFSDWTHPFDTNAARTACDAGIVPMLTWESWSWGDISNGEPAYSQPSYSPRLIAAGKFDGYLKAFAASVKVLGCPIVIRFDQEVNGHWYPWGLATAGMHNTAAEYVAMWRHVWDVFHRAGVRNAIWLWSPNVLYHHGVNQLAASYPGNKYVDGVGIDGYLVYPSDTAATVFPATFRELRGIAPSKPWLIAETGVATGPQQASKITGLLKMIASNRRLIGMTYLDEHETRANWIFTANPASLAAFRAGISVPAFGQAVG